MVKDTDKAVRQLPTMPPLEQTTVAISSLRFGESPRLVPEDLEHARGLACVASESLPPILVRAQTMTVIDGRHLVLAARLRGDSTIRARLFHGSEEEAFLLAVRSNTTHGKPLSLADRLRAATRILESHPEFSDRMIASVCGLSPRTVAGHRKTGSTQKPSRRVVKGGRVRPLSSQIAREQAGELMRAFPDESNRRIAGDVGLSESTVRDVRRRMSKGSDAGR